MDGVIISQSSLQTTSTQSSDSNTQNEHRIEIDSLQKIEDIRRRARMGELLTNQEIGILDNDSVYQKENTDKAVAAYRQIYRESVRENSPETQSICQIFQALPKTDKVFITTVILVAGYIYTGMMKNILKKI